LAKVVRNTASLAGSTLSFTILGLLQIKILSTYLSLEDLGIYFAVYALGALASVAMQIGMPMVVARFLAEYEALERFTDSRRLVYLAWGIVGATGIILVIIAAGGGEAIADSLGWEQVGGRMLGWSLTFCLFFSLLAVTRSGYEGLRMLHVPLIFDTLFWVLVVSFTYYFGTHDLLSVVRVFQIQTFSAIFVLAVFSVFLMVELTRGKMSSSDIPYFRRLFPFWYGAATTSVLGALFDHLDRFLVGVLLSFSDASIFGVASRLLYNAKRVLAVPLPAVSPEITRKSSLGIKEVLGDDLWLVMRIMFAGGVILFAALAGLAQPVVSLVASDSYVHVPLLFMMAATLPVLSLYASVTTAMRAVNRIGYAVASDILWISSYIVSAIILVPGVGLLGFGIGQVVATALTGFYNLAYVIRKTSVRIDGKPLAVVGVVGLTLSFVVYLGSRFVHPAVSVPAGLILIGVVLNFVSIRSGLLSSADKDRIESLEGLRFLRPIVRLFFEWPERIAHWAT
jgi:O-antigen/teichoic acid export membrane protein